MRVDLMVLRLWCLDGIGKFIVNIYIRFSNMYRHEDGHHHDGHQQGVAETVLDCMGKSIDVTCMAMKMVTITTGTSKVWHRQCWIVWVNL